VPLPGPFHELARRVNNWGRWGPDDERGTLNLITPDVVRRGAGCVRTGKHFALALPLGPNGPQSGLIPGRVNPQHLMIAINTPTVGDPSGICSSDDVAYLPLQAATHWDSLAHVSYGGRMWNGFPVSSVDVRGAGKAGIDRAGAVVGRGVLLDVARCKGVDRLDGGYAVTADDLSAAEELAGVRVEPGDIVLVRTGQMQLFLQGDRLAYTAPAPGLSMRSVPWLRERDVAAVATDNLTLEVVPGEREDAILPVHLLHLVEMGLLQGQNWNLEQLSADCADDGVYAFFLSATPEPFRRGLGGPVAPVAVK
jgi:kynurenine formamidase